MLPSAQVPTFFGPVHILPRFFHAQLLHQKLCLPMQPENVSSGPDPIASLESICTGPRLMLFLNKCSWFALALLNQESHEHVAFLLALQD